MDESTASSWIFREAFSAGEIGNVGVELEWICVASGSPGTRPDLPTLQAALGDGFPQLAQGSVVSFEPGGQIELSSPPARSVAECIQTTEQDLADVRRRLGEAGIDLLGCGLDRRRPVLMSDLPRYRVLEAHYNRFGRYGRIMMCNAASVQVSVDAGDGSAGWRGRAFRWRLANGLGPILLAAFANSPGTRARPWRSTRQVYRFRTDPTRTHPVPIADDPRAAWVRYAMAAQVVGVQEPDGTWLPGKGVPLTGWLRGRGHRRLTELDLRHHVKTVIPPVRPSGRRLEFRMVDAQPDDGWRVVAAVIATLMDEPSSAMRASEVVETLPAPIDPGHWLSAASSGLADGRIRQAAHACLGIAVDGLQRLDAPPSLIDEVREFGTHYTYAGRCPGDDRRPW